MEPSVYNIEETTLPLYIQQTVKEGCCPALLPCALCSSEGSLLVSPRTEGLIRLDQLLSKPSDRILSGYKELLCAVQGILQAAICCRSWFIPDRFISLQAEDIYFAKDRTCARVLLKPQQETFENRLLQLLEDLAGQCPQTDAPVLLERLREQGPSLLSDHGQLHRACGRWAEELRR